MAELLLKAIKPTLLEYIEKARAAGPAAVAQLILKLQTWLPATLDKLAAWLKVTAAKELPAAGPALNKLTIQAADFAKAKVTKLL